MGEAGVEVEGRGLRRGEKKTEKNLFLCFSPVCLWPFFPFRAMVCRVGEGQRERERERESGFVSFAECFFDLFF